MILFSLIIRIVMIILCLLAIFSIFMFITTDHNTFFKIFFICVVVSSAIIFTFRIMGMSF
jgi:hypothetical protein